MPDWQIGSRMSSEQQTPMATINDQMALLEKSYQLAAKYMHQAEDSHLPI